MKVSIVIPNWNGRQKLERNIPKILEVEGVSEIIIVDDASTDDGVAFLKEHYGDEIILIEKKVNSRFGATVNLGVKQAKGDLIFLLNNDASPEKDAVKNALKHFKNERVFSVSCNVGGNWSWAKWEDGYFWHGIAKQKKSEDEELEAHETMWASGGSGIFRKSIWQELEGFDELFSPFYEEDTDLGYRALKRGFINIWEPESKVEHYKEKGVIALNFSQSNINAVAQRNQLLFIWKNITDKDWTKEHNTALIKKIIAHPKYFAIFWDAYKRWDQLKKKRTKEEAHEVMSDREIIAKFYQEI